ncbi:urea transporter [Stutzerimonas urumqiensis]|uniref:urea transporter n=1 Tax=Stutzerimonas urumqiensis TaxID=638269 RepID=UPI003DA21CA4
MPASLHWLLTSVFNGFSQIFLLVHPVCGALLLLAFAIGAPALLAGALLGTLVATLGAWRLGYGRRDIGEGLYGYNAALLGALLTLTLGVTVLALALTVIGAWLTALMQAWWLRARQRGPWPPAYTLAFVLLGVLAVQSLQALGLVPPTVAAVPIADGWTAWPVAIVRGVGQVIFLDHALAGLCVLLALGVADRAALGWALAGSSLGLALALAMQVPTAPLLSGLAGYNGALIALVLRGLPGGRLMLLPGVALGLLMQQGLLLLGLAPLTLPFILCGWLAQLARRLTHPDRLRAR